MFYGFLYLYSSSTIRVLNPFGYYSILVDPIGMRCLKTSFIEALFQNFYFVIYTFICIGWTIESVRKSNLLRLFLPLSDRLRSSSPGHQRTPPRVSELVGQIRGPHQTVRSVVATWGVYIGKEQDRCSQSTAKRFRGHLLYYCRSLIYWFAWMEFRKILFYGTPDVYMGPVREPLPYNICLLWRRVACELV